MSGRGFEFVKRIEKEENIQLPKRSTKRSAGYDFYLNDERVEIPSIWKSIFKIHSMKNNMIRENKLIKPTYVKTGIKSYMEEDEVLYIYNRSSNPLKLGLILSNSVGVIDSDYYNNESNEGEISFGFYNILPFDIVLIKGNKLGQGIFSKFLKTNNDNYEDKERIGGYGSTGK